MMKAYAAKLASRLPGHTRMNLSHFKRLCRKHNFKWTYVLGLLCPGCDNETEIVSSEIVYGEGRDFGDIMYCKKCGTYVGIHTHGDKKGQSKGMLADKADRLWRKKAHNVFDWLWLTKLLRHPEMEKEKARTRAYKWLSEKMKLPRDLTHIAFFGEVRCKEVVMICLPYLVDNFTLEMEKIGSVLDAMDTPEVRKKLQEVKKKEQEMKLARVKKARFYETPEGKLEKEYIECEGQIKPSKI